jgi:RNA polymerase sigma-70 factor (ECF subfamily)
MMRHDPLANPEPLIKRVYAYVSYRIGDGPDAEDITNETFERAIRRRSSYDPSRGEPIAWLFGIARRCLADTMSARLLTVAEVPEEAGRDDVAEDTATRLTLADAVATLDERDQELIALRYGADLTAKRIAAILELETNAVEVALHRALGRLRERMEVPALSSRARLASPAQVPVEQKS